MKTRFWCDVQSRIARHYNVVFFGIFGILTKMNTASCNMAFARRSLLSNITFKQLVTNWGGIATCTSWSSWISSEIACVRATSYNTKHLNQHTICLAMISKRVFSKRTFCHNKTQHFVHHHPQPESKRNKINEPANDGHEESVTFQCQFLLLFGIINTCLS